MDSVRYVVGNLHKYPIVKWLTLSKIRGYHARVKHVTHKTTLVPRRDCIMCESNYSNTTVSRSYCYT